MAVFWDVATCKLTLKDVSQEITAFITLTDTRHFPYIGVTSSTPPPTNIGTNSIEEI
jgi:hypothetical protein